MRAKAAYRLIVTRTGRVPGVLADRVDHVEVQCLDDLEVVLFWDVPARETTRVEEALRADLEGLSADEFLARWSAVEDPTAR